MTFVHAAACRRFSVPSADLTARRPVSQRQKWLLQRQSCTYCFEAAIFLLLLLPVITGVAATLAYPDTFLVLCSSSPPPVVCLSRQCFFKGERGREVRREGLLHSNRLWQFLGWHGGADCSCCAVIRVKSSHSRYGKGRPEGSEEESLLLFKHQLSHSDESYSQY